MSLLESCSDILTDIPGKTIQAIHTMKLTDDQPIKLNPYNLPLNQDITIKKILEELVRLDMIEPSHSPYEFPVVEVK